MYIKLPFYTHRQIYRFLGDCVKVEVGDWPLRKVLLQMDKSSSTAGPSFPTGPTGPTGPFSRTIKLEAHVLAYLGQYMNTFEESIKNLCTSAQTQSSQVNTASSHGRS